MLRNTLAEEELIANAEKCRDARNKIRAIFLDLFCTLFEFVEKILVPNCSKEKSLAHQQHKSSLVPAATNLEVLNKISQKFTSISRFGKGINESKECLHVNIVIYYLVVGILFQLPAGFPKNPDSQYQRTI